MGFKNESPFVLIHPIQIEMLIIQLLKELSMKGSTNCIVFQLILDYV